jgi:hypothetical protein
MLYGRRIRAIPGPTRTPRQTDTERLHALLALPYDASRIQPILQLTASTLEAHSPQEWFHLIGGHTVQLAYIERGVARLIGERIYKDTNLSDQLVTPYKAFNDFVAHQLSVQARFASFLTLAQAALTGALAAQVFTASHQLERLDDHISTIATHFRGIAINHYSQVLTRGHLNVYRELSEDQTLHNLPRRWWRELVHDLLVLQSAGATSHAMKQLVAATIQGNAQPR